MDLTNKKVAELMYTNRNNYINIPGFNEYIKVRLYVSKFNNTNMIDSLTFRPLTIQYNDCPNLSYGLHMLIAEYLYTTTVHEQLKYIFNFANTQISLSIPKNLESEFKKIQPHDYVTLIGYYYFTQSQNSINDIYFSPLYIQNSTKSELKVNQELEGTDLSIYNTADITLCYPIYCEFKSKLTYRKIGLSSKFKKPSIEKLISIHSDKALFEQYLETLKTSNQNYIKGESHDN